MPYYRATGYRNPPITRGPRQPGGQGVVGSNPAVPTQRRQGNTGPRATCKITRVDQGNGRAQSLRPDGAPRDPLTVAPWWPGPRPERQRRGLDHRDRQPPTQG